VVGSVANIAVTCFGREVRSNRAGRIDEFPHIS